MTSEVDIAKLALSHLGDRYDLTALTDSTPEAEQINLVFDSVRDNLLREHPWKFAVRNIHPTALDDDSVVTISGATQANPVVVTTTSSHGLSDGDTVFISGVVGMTELNGLGYTVANKTGTTFELQDTTPTDVDGTSYGAYTSGGTVYEGKVPGNWSYMFTYPSDCLKVLDVVNPMGEDYDPLFFDVGLNSAFTKVLMCNEEEPEFRYIYRVTDPTLFGASFSEALAVKIAARVCVALTGDSRFMSSLVSLSGMMVEEAKSQDGNEGVGPSISKGPDWLQARL